MPKKSSFHQLVQRMRDGDRDAASHLWREFRPAIERKIKFELRKYGLVARGFSEERIQSVALLFFDRLWRGKLDSALERCEKPEQLLNLFRKMAQGKVVDWLRKENAARRDQSKKRRVDGIDPIDNASTPSQVASHGEQVERANSLLTGEERRIIELHADHNWDEIAQILDLGKEAVRKRYERAIARVKQQLDA